MKGWAMPVPPVKRKMVLENRKYCTLYPREVKKLVKKSSKPSCKFSKTPYTKCDFKLEACVQEQLLKLENQLRAHYDLVSKEKTIQFELCKKLWDAATRYTILTRGGVCYKTYPEIVSRDVEYRILCEFHHDRKDIDRSSCRLRASLKQIKLSLKQLDHRVKLLDHTVRSPLLTGSWRQPSLQYLKDLVKTMYFFYYEQICKFKSWALLIDAGSPSSIEDYQVLVGPPTIGDEQYVFVTTEHCSCMRTKNSECLEPHHSCRRHNKMKQQPPKNEE